MAGMNISVRPINDGTATLGAGTAVNMGSQPDGVLNGMAATMEVAGIESIPGVQSGPMMVGYSAEEE